MLPSLHTVITNQLLYLVTLFPAPFQEFFFNCAESDVRIHLVSLVISVVIIKYHSALSLRSLIDVVLYDVPGRKKRFSVLYVLLSLQQNARLVLRTQTDEIAPLMSLTRIFQNSNWLEREAWDMFGVFFCNHFDLRRILTDYGFNGHPLRKDFPLTGFTELWFSAFLARIVKLPVSLVQEFRVFSQTTLRFSLAEQDLTDNSLMVLTDDVFLQNLRRSTPSLQNPLS